jgi:hypothetical protein
VEIVSLMLKVRLQILDRSTLIFDCLGVDREQDEEVTTHDCLAKLAILRSSKLRAPIKTNEVLSNGPTSTTRCFVMLGMSMVHRSGDTWQP